MKNKLLLECFDHCALKYWDFEMKKLPGGLKVMATGQFFKPTGSEPGQFCKRFGFQAGSANKRPIYAFLFHVSADVVRFY